MNIRYARAFFVSLCLGAALAWSGLAVAQPGGAAARPWGDWYLSVTGGAFHAKDNPGQLQSPGSGIALGIAAGFRYSPHVDLEVEMPLFFSRYDTPATVLPPLYGTVSSRADVSTLGIVGNIIFSTRSQSMRAYAGGGGGLYSSRFSVSAQTFGLPGTYDVNDDNFGYQWLAGVDLRMGAQSWLGLQYRQVELTANFGAVTNGDVNLGGRFILLAYRYGL